MNTENKDEIREKFLEISNLTHILRMALMNNEQENDDTLPYGRFATSIEDKINSLYDTFDSTYS